MMIWCVRDPDAVAAQICVLLAPVGETEAAREAQIVVREVLIAVIPGVAVPAAGIPEVATAMDRHGAVIADREARIAVIPVTGIHVTGIHGAATGVHVGRVAATPEGATAVGRHGAVIAGQEPITETTAAPLEGIAGIGAREHPGPTTARIAQIGRLGARQVRVEAIAVEGKILQALGVVHATVDHKPRHHSACDFG